MKRLGICQKCGKETIVRDHHWKGYSKEHKDDVIPYCQSCDQLAHSKARREGLCILDPKESSKKSRKSCIRRSLKTKQLSNETMMLHIQLFELVSFNINTGHIYIGSYFSGQKGKKLYYIDI